MNKVFHPYFTISGEFDPDDITLQLEIQPSWVQRIGDPGPPDALGPRRGAVWGWQPQDDDSHDVGDQLAFMAGALSLKHGKVASLSRDFHRTFHIYHRQSEGRGNWFLSANTLRLIADLQVDIECEQVRPEDGAYI
jgi:hypothetical protein